MTERDDLREAFSKIVIESDRDWNGNVSQYRKYLVDRLTDSGLFGIAATPAPGYDQEAVAWMVKNDFGHWHATMDRALAATWRDTERLEVQPLYTAPPSSRMRRALEPFARASDGITPLLSGHSWVTFTVEGIPFGYANVGDFRAAREALRAGDNHNGDIEQQYSEAIDKLNRATDREINASDGGKTYRVEYDGFVGTKQGEYVTREGKRGVVLQQVGTKVVHVYNEARIVPVDYASDGKESEGGAESRSARSTKAGSVRGEAGPAPSQDGSLAQLAAGVAPGPSDPTPLDRDAIAWGLAEKWPGDFMQGDDEDEREPNALAYETADTAILALQPRAGG